MLTLNLEVVDRLDSEKTREALKRAHHEIMNHAFVVCGEPAFEEPELATGELHPAGSEAVRFAFENVTNSVLSVLRDRVISSLAEPQIITLEDLWNAFYTYMRVSAEDFETVYPLFAGNVRKIILRPRSSPPFAVGELPRRQIFRLPPGSEDATAYQIASGDAPEPSVQSETLIWEQNGIQIKLAGKGIAELDPQNSVESSAGEIRHFVYFRALGIMSETACDQLYKELSKVIPSIVRSISAYQRRAFSNQAATNLPWISGEVLLRELPFLRHCVDSFYLKKVASESIDRRLREATKLLVAADQQPDFAASLALAFSAIEAMLCEGNDNIAEQLAWKTSTLLAQDGEQRLKTEPIVKKLYNVRSRAMHGDNLEVAETQRDSVRKLSAGVMKAIFERRAIVKRLGANPEAPKDLFEALKTASRLNKSVDGVPAESGDWLPTSAD